MTFSFNSFINIVLKVVGGPHVTVYNILKIFWFNFCSLNKVNIIKISNRKDLNSSQWQNSETISLKACFNQQIHFFIYSLTASVKNTSTKVEYLFGRFFPLSCAVLKKGWNTIFLLRSFQSNMRRSFLISFDCESALVHCFINFLFSFWFFLMLQFFLCIYLFVSKETLRLFFFENKYNCKYCCGW